MERLLLFLYAESPVHAGADSSLGVVDLPMQRDGHTRLPVIWGQSLKGALRAHPKPASWGRQDVLDAFGAAPPNPGSNNGDGGDSGGMDARELKPGSLAVGDAELVAFPAPTLEATFAWVTSPLALGRLRRKAALVGIDQDRRVPDPEDPGVVLAGARRWTGQKRVVGPYVVDGRSSPEAKEWARWLSATALPGPQPAGGREPHQVFRDKLAEDFVVVHDDLLVQITEECAEITPRVQLKAGVKTVEHGPFYTEYLPTESLLATVVEGSRKHLEMLTDLLNGQVLRIGGDETIGKGLMWCTVVRAVPA